MISPLRRAALLGAVLAACAGLLSGCGGSSGLSVTARFTDAAGLFEGNDVGVLGVRVGEVTSITPNGDHVDVGLHVDPGVKIPADAGAVIVSRSVATDRYVELTPVYDSGPVLGGGAVLGRNRTRTPVEFDDLLAAVRDLTGDLAGPDGEATPVNDLLEVAAKTLDGEGGTVASTLHDLAGALEAANGSSGDAAGTVKNLDTLTAALASNDALVRRFTGEVADATDLLDDEHESMQATFDALAAMVRRVTAFSRDHRAQVRSQVDDIESIVKAMVDDRERLAQTIETLPLMMQNVDRAIDDHDRINIRVRPGDLVPGAAAAKILCSNLPDGACDALDAATAPLFDLLQLFAGVQEP